MGYYDLDKAVKYYIRFRGYGHSGHTLVGAILDAHPNCAILNGYHSHTTVEEFIKERISQRDQFKKREGFLYDFTIEGQGGEKDLISIGHTNTEKGTSVPGLEEKNILTIRNPIMVISHMWRKRINRTSSNDHLMDALRDFDRIMEESLSHRRIFYMWLEEWIEQPRTWLEDLCDFVGITFYRTWAKNSISIIDPKPPRLTAPWKEWHLMELDRIVDKYPILHRYRR